MERVVEEQVRELGRVLVLVLAQVVEVGVVEEEYKQAGPESGSDWVAAGRLEHLAWALGEQTSRQALAWESRPEEEGEVEDFAAKESELPPEPWIYLLEAEKSTWAYHPEAEESPWAGSSRPWWCRRGCRRNQQRQSPFLRRRLPRSRRRCRV